MESSVRLLSVFDPSLVFHLEFFSTLTNIMCTENEQKLKIKDLEGEEKLLASHKEMARKLRLDKEANEETVRELKGNVSALKKEVEAFDANIVKLNDLRSELTDLNGKTEKLNFEIRNLLSRQEPLEETIRAAGEDPDGFDESSMEDVTESRNKLHSAMESGSEKRDEVEGMIIRANNEVAAIEASLSSARQLESDLRAEMQQFKNRVNEWKRNSLNVSNRLLLIPALLSLPVPHWSSMSALAPPRSTATCARACPLPSGFVASRSSLHLYLF